LPGEGACTRGILIGGGKAILKWALGRAIHTAPANVDRAIAGGQVRNVNVVIDQHFAGTICRGRIRSGREKRDWSSGAGEVEGICVEDDLILAIASSGLGRPDVERREELARILGSDV